MARNSGLAAAIGKYVVFIDSDDYVGPNLLKTLYDAARENDADMTFGGFTFVSSNGRKRPCPCVAEPHLFSGNSVRELIFNTVGSPPEAALDSLYGMTACARLYRRSVLEKHAVRFVSERQLISEDLLFNLDFLNWMHRAVAVPDASYFYCTNEGSLSKRHRADRFDCDCELYVVVKKWLSAHFEETEYRRYLQRLLISRARFDIAQEVVYHDQTDRRYPLFESLRKIADTPLAASRAGGLSMEKTAENAGVVHLVTEEKKAAVTGSVCASPLCLFLIEWPSEERRHREWKRRW